MKKLLDFVAHALFILFTIAVHLVMVTIFDYPISAINILFIILILHLLLYESLRVVWMSIAVFYILELFVSSPFGVLLFSGTYAIYLAYVLHLNVFPNRNLVASTLLLFITLICFRFLYVLFSIFAFLFQEGSPAMGHLVGYAAWELLLTGLVFLVIYPVVLHILQKRFFIQ
ncbi:hypothetical protein H6758_00145 [Candidatus Nomurabacteria bacterium]|nr:hypothetical protein [Candidatus Nomurabacteria bacterium]